MAGMEEISGVGSCGGEGAVVVSMVASLVSDSESLGGVLKGTFETGWASLWKVGACMISTFFATGL